MIIYIYKFPEATNFPPKRRLKLSIPMGRLDPKTEACDLVHFGALQLLEVPSEFYEASTESDGGARNMGGCLWMDVIE